MARREPSPIEAFETRAREYLLVHRRIAGDFERSLKNARQFIKLASRSLEQEPDGTIQMLEQIREIDLLGHVTQQYDEYQGVMALLPQDLVQGDPTLPDSRVQSEIKAMRARYEAIVQEAESQAEDLEKILSALTTPH
jgi:hypothetical protein